MKNKLLVYKGGGYDGCIWEYNMCYWNDKENWKDIYSSGYAGLKTKENAIEYLNNDKNNGDDYDIIDLDNQDEIDNLCEHHSLNLIWDLVQWFNENEGESKFWIECKECNKKSYDPEEIKYEDYHGNGGIGIEIDNFICHECRSMNSCPNCHEYFSGNELKNYGYYRNENDEIFCEYCIDSIIRDNLRKIEMHQMLIKEIWKNEPALNKKEIKCIEIIKDLMDENEKMENHKFIEED